MECGREKYHINTAGVVLGWESGPSILFHNVHMRWPESHSIHHQRYAVSSDYSYILQIKKKCVLYSACLKLHSKGSQETKHGNTLTNEYSLDNLPQ